MKFVDTSEVVPVSVTGAFCPMRCAHCNGRYLKHMVPAREMEEYAKRGRRVFLISGGMLPDGTIPFEPYYELLKRLKERYSLKYNFHIGFPKETPRIVDELADVVSADFFADPDVMEKVYRIRREPGEILRVLKGFSKPVVPHLTIGVNCGKVTHEPYALDILSGDFDRIVLNVFIPTPGTEFQACPPPSIEDVLRVVERARNLFKRVFLGCMQPRGRYRFELQTKLLKLVDGITKPVIGGERVFNCCAFVIME